MMRFVLCVVLIILEYAVAKNPLPEPDTWSFRPANLKMDIHVESGIVRGKLVNDGDGEYFAFLGIPYAAPPTSNNRFMAPLPPIPWNGILHANRTVNCPQSGSGEEDCLVLNVFTPAKPSKRLAPVMVYIHGGSFIIGAGDRHGVAPLIKQNMVVVTINYRLGALGFLCLGLDEAPGNAGLKDQNAALRWVQNNIKEFGGDPTRVTLYGMSSGAASVELHVLSKMSTGLFQRAIVESGSATSVWVNNAQPIETALDFAQWADCPPRSTKNLYNLLHYYRNESASNLSEINMYYYNHLIDGTFGFVPCVEKRSNTAEPFITKSPYEILVKQEFIKVPMMFIYSSLEGLYLRSAEYYEEDYKNRMGNDFVDFLPADLNFDTDEIKQEVAESIQSFYFGNKTIGDSGNLINYLNYFGDYLILHGLLNSAEKHSRNGNPVYLMEFAYKGSMGSYEKFYENITLAGHGDVIKHAIVKQPTRDPDDKLAIDRVTQLITNFVKYGNPTPTPTPQLPVIWPQVVPGNVSYLYMDREFIVREEPYWGRKVFWDILYNKYRRRVRPVEPRFL